MSEPLPRARAALSTVLTAALVLAFAVFLPAVRAHANGLHEESPPTEATPRGAVELFYERARKRDFDRAADLLRAPGRTLENPGVRAQQLYEVLLRHTVFDAEDLSDRSEGSLDDGLPAGQEDVARVPTTAGTQPVRLVRLASGAWVLSRESFAKIPEWHAALGNRWLRAHLPPSLQRPWWYGLALWQWMALPIGAVTLYVLARLLGGLAGYLTHAAARRTKTALDDELLVALRRPRNLGLYAMALYVALPWVGLPAAVETALARAIATLGYLALIWVGVRVLDVLAALARESAYVKARPVTEGFLPLGTKLAKVTVFVIAVAMVLQWLGLPVASIVASLGIGGVAVALAAKTTVENLLGALSLSADRAFRPGDLVRIDELVGVVEHIGLRSTRIRTPDRTVVAVPNGRLAELRIESLSARDRMRTAFTLVVPPSATAKTVREVLAGVEKAVRAQPLAIQDEVSVLVRDLSPVGVVLEVTAWLQTQDLKTFAAARQELLLAVLEAVEAAGTSLVAPAQWVVSQNAPKV